MLPDSIEINAGNKANLLDGSCELRQNAEGVVVIGTEFRDEAENIGVQVA
jgi:hypothetical protein